MISARHSFIDSVIFCIIISSLLVGTLAGFSGLASLFGFILVLLQLRQGGWSSAQIKTVTMAFLIGGAWEGIVVHQGWLQYQGTTGYHALAWWMLIFWMAIGTMMNGALSGLRGHPFRSLLLGSCFGPLFAMAGEHMGVLIIADANHGLQSMALGWGFIFALLPKLSQRYTAAETSPFR
ncbi:MAG: hypothetical protein RLZ25_807 [Pseudomonadota bacterium]|jgi:hypothetical protein